jgi:LmbE family N-acetylglucosaminyl deacetylase
MPPAASAATDAASVQGPISEAGAERQIETLWVGAHPDDELYVAPQFAAECIEQKRKCSLLVMTRGESGKCQRPLLCSSGLANQRVAELRASAASLGADVEQWDFADVDTGTAAVAKAWSAMEGGDQALLGRIREFVRSLNPKHIYTFDPRHGTTCHSAHRATAGLLYLALKDTSLSSRVRYLQTRVLLDDKLVFSGVGAMVPSDTTVVRLDASASSLVRDGDLWRYLTEVMGAHASQFSDTKLDGTKNVPLVGRGVYWFEAANLRIPDERYDTLCR